MREHSVERASDRPCTDNTRATRMDASNVILIRPALHHLFNIGGLECCIEGHLDFVRTASKDSMVVCSFGHEYVLRTV